MRNALAAAMVLTMALCIYAAVVAFAAVTPDFAAPAYGLALLLALLWAGKLFASKAVSWKHSPMHIMVGAFIAYAVARYMFSPLEYESRLDLIDICCCGLVYFIAASNFYRPRDRAWFLWALLLLAIFESVLGIWQFSTHAHTVFGFERPDQYQNRGGGTFICSNSLAGFLEIILGLLIGRLVFYRSSSFSVQQLALRKIVLGYGALIVLAGLITTLSRGGWIAASVAIVSLVFWGSWEFRRLWIRASMVLLAISLLAGFCFGIGPVQTYIRVTLSGQDREKLIPVKDVSLGGRTMMWQSTWEMIQAHPVFGTGGMTWEWFHLKYRKPGIQFRPEHAHNDILQYTSDYGVVGAVLLCGIIGCFFWQAMLLARDGASADQRSFAVGAALAMTAILVHSLFDFNMHILANSLLLSAICGFTAAAEDPKRRFKRIELGRLPRYGLGVAMLAVCAVGIWVVMPTCLAARYTFLGNGAKAGLEWDWATYYYTKAISLDRKSWEPYWKLGDVERAKAEYRTRPEERKQLAHDAVVYYEKALVLNPLNSEVMVHEARAYEIVGENEQALKLYNRAIEVDPNGALAYLNLGRFYAHIGNPEKAIEAYKKSKELNWFTDQVAEINLQELTTPSQ